MMINELFVFFLSDHDDLQKKKYTCQKTLKVQFQDNLMVKKNWKNKLSDQKQTFGINPS